MTRLDEIFQDRLLCEKIKHRLPYLFQMAEMDAFRGGKIGMEVGSIRERVLIALMEYKFGKEAVNRDVPITESQVDVKLYNEDISIKTITKNLGGVKAVWTVDPQRARYFIDNYRPECEILLALIKWDSNPIMGALPGTNNHPGGLFLIPLETQRKLFNRMGRRNYLDMPPPNTNPRGVEYSIDAIIGLLQDSDTLNIPIMWKKRSIDYDPNLRWVKEWEKD